MNSIDARAGNDEDADLAAIVAPPSAKFGGGSLLSLGVLTLVLCLQTVLVVRRYEGILVAVIAIMFVLGVACAGLGFRTRAGTGKPR